MTDCIIDGVEMYDPMKMRLFEGGRIGFVYFICIGRSGPIKIGWSRNPEKRFRQIQENHPHQLWIVGLLPGTLADEKKLHRRFANARVRGEWFEASKIWEGIIELLMDEGLVNVSCKESRIIPEKGREQEFFCCLIRC